MASYKNALNVLREKEILLKKYFNEIQCSVCPAPLGNAWLNAGLNN